MGRIAFINALVFDGNSFFQDLTVVINDGIIESIGTLPEVQDLQVIDCVGLTLLPGFIDAHVHLASDPQGSHQLLVNLAKAGVTTALDMGFLPHSIRESFQDAHGIPEIKFAGNFATSSGSTHSRFPNAPKTSIVDSPEMAVQFVEDRVAEGANYIKIIADIPGPSQDVVNTLAAEAQKYNKLSVAHASRKAAFVMAQLGKVDIITHVPIDEPIDDIAAQLMKEEGRVCVPTLIMMKGVASAGIFPGLMYSAAKESVSRLHQAGVPILAGTDSNQSPRAGVKHGEAFHQELELLVEAGLSNEEALRAGTSLPAKWFRMGDRGVIGAGKRADLVLVRGNTFKDIKNTTNLNRLWIAGNEVILS